MLARIRDFFAARAVLEVETPILGAATSTEPHLASLETDVHAAGGGGGLEPTFTPRGAGACGCSCRPLPNSR